MAWLTRVWPPDNRGLGTTTDHHPNPPARPEPWPRTPDSEPLWRVKRENKALLADWIRTHNGLDVT